MCKVCDKNKDIEDFPYKSKAEDIRHTYCKQCHINYNRKHYENNKDYYIEKSRESKRKWREEYVKLVVNHLKKHPCASCGEADLAVLEFDHIKGRKHMAVSSMARKYCALSKVKREIQKCQVLCANCHRRKTAHEQGWGKINY